MDADAMYPSKWLKAADVKGREKVQITEVSSVEVREGQPKKIELKFNELDKGLVLNKTNVDKLIATYGKETNNWIGKTIELYTVLVNYRGEEVASIRLNPLRETEDTKAFMP